MSFDPAKESFHLLHRTLHQGDNFRVLGVHFDPQLRMDHAARVVSTEAGWRLQKLLRARRFYSTRELVHLYKAQVLSYLESSTPGLYHAAHSVLDKVDRVQRRLLRAVGCTELQGLLDHRLAPLPSRRDIAMMGVLHRIVLGEAPPQLVALFPVLGAVSEPAGLQRLRGWRPRHTRQLATPATYNSTELLRRSLFGLVECYNWLPQKAVDCKTVKAFQRTLQNGLESHAGRELDEARWQRLCTEGWRELSRKNFDRLFA